MIQKQEYKEIDDPKVQELLNSFLGIDEEEAQVRRKRYLLLKKLGLITTLVYHCQRCNYLWLPKDFDAQFSDYGSIYETIANLVPPKACARCKSRQWNKEPVRNTKRTVAVPEKYDSLGFTTFDKIDNFGHNMLTLKRLKAHKRIIDKKIRELEKAEQDLNNI